MDFSLQELLSFLGIVLLLVMFPGPNTVLVMHSVGVNGKKAGFFNVAGIISALYFHALLAALGLSVILTQSAQLYLGIKYLGAIYILYLGLTNLYSSFMQRNTPNNKNLQPTVNTNKITLNNFAPFFCKGFITNILNPKVALFYLSFIPQFIHHQNNFLIEALFLTFLYSLISASWYSLLVLSVDKFQSFLGKNTLKQRIKALTGVILVGLSVKMIVDSK